MDESQQMLKEKEKVERNSRVQMDKLQGEITLVKLQLSNMTKDYTKANKQLSEEFQNDQKES